MALILGHVVNEAHRRRSTILHYMGLLCGALTTAAVLFVVGWPVRMLHDDAPLVTQALCVTVACVLIGWAVQVITNRGLAYPRPRWQVPEQWRYTLPHGFTMGGYGYLLGLGITTNPMLPAIWVLCGLTVVTQSALVVVVAWCLYAGVRMGTTHRATRVVLRLRATRPGADPDGDLNDARLLSVARAANVALLATLAVTAIIAAGAT